MPKVFEIVSHDGRYGIIYEKIDGFPMWEQIQSEHLFERFIAEHKKLLDISTDVLMSYKEFLIEMISRGNNREISGDIVKKISDLPDGSSVLHGDYHPGNVMIVADKKAAVSLKEIIQYAEKKTGRTASLSDSCQRKCRS